MDPLSKHFEFLKSSLDTLRPHSGWRPAADLYRRPGGWLIKFDLAGVKAEDIQLELSGRFVKVSGTRRDCTLHEGQEAHQIEIAYSRFERVIELPESINAASYRTQYSDGMFLVEISKQDAGNE